MSSGARITEPLRRVGLGHLDPPPFFEGSHKRGFADCRAAKSEGLEKSGVAAAVSPPTPAATTKVEGEFTPPREMTPLRGSGLGTKIPFLVGKCSPRRSGCGHLGGSQAARPRGRGPSGAEVACAPDSCGAELPLRELHNGHVRRSNATTQSEGFRSCRVFRLSIRGRPETATMPE
jgi:hypothetical protein